MKIQHWQLKQRQSQPLEIKIRMTDNRIRQWYEHWDGEVYVSFSGGMDSTVLLHRVRSLYPDVPAVFIKALPYPEIFEHVKAIEDVVILKPAKSFVKIVQEYGWPVVSKKISMGVDRYHAGDKTQKHLRLWGGINPSSGKKQAATISKCWHFLVDAPFRCSEKCCYWTKEKRFAEARKVYGAPLVGVRVTESDIRRKKYYERGCNAYHYSSPTSWPLAFWTDADIWQYVTQFNVPYSRIYDMGYKRTGCFPCAFGAHLEKEPNRFQRMKITHPRLWDWCGDIGLWDVLDYVGVPYNEPLQMSLEM